MGIRQIITDDLTGEEVPSDTKTTDVRVDGEDYSLYLSDESKETFLALLRGEAPILANTRPATATRKRAASRTNSNAAEIRAWAKDKGMQVPDRGRIPAEVMEAWDKK